MAEPVNSQPKNVAPRRRKSPPRRTPAIIEQRERKPFVLGWGADLDRRQREALKERIALFAGVLIAAVLVVLLGWGWYQDNVAGPAARNAVNNQVVAVVGSKTITYGYFKRVALFNKKQLDSNLAQYQQQQTQLSGSSASDKAGLAQVNQQISQIQQELSVLPTAVESNLIDDYTVLQRAKTVGVTVSKKELDKAIRKQELQAGGIRNLNKYINQGGLSRAEYLTLVKSGLLVTKLQAKLAKSAPHRQTEVNAAHILVAPNKKALAEKVLKQVRAGGNFARLAKKYSKDTASAKKGGVLGYAVPSTYVGPFAKAVSSMKIGEVRLVKSQYGWHIIKLLGRKPVKLTGTAYQQAQQTAYTSWLQRQQNSLHIQKIMDVTKIPGIAEPISPTAPQSSTLPPQPAVTLPTAGTKSGKKPASTKK